MNERQKKQLQIAKQKAIINGGICLSDDYNNVFTKLLRKCKNHNHKEWYSTYKNVYDGSWCPECKLETIKSKNKLNDGLEQAIKYAESKGGKCLSNSYKNTVDKLLWQCENQSHKQWMANFNYIVRENNWCPECSKDNLRTMFKNKNGLNEAIEHAKKKGGECLSTTYINSREYLIWKCDNENHKEWKASYSEVVIQDNWCRSCSSKNISEKRTRLIFERFFNKSFPSSRPSWNINCWTGSLLELDGYCKEFNIAFEYDGEQHFKVVNFNGKEMKKNSYIYQKFKDEQKKKNCRKNNVLLIKIPYINQKYKNRFDIFLNNIINACMQNDLIMQFNDDDLASLEKDFYLVK